MSILVEIYHDDYPVGYVMAHDDDERSAIQERVEEWVSRTSYDYKEIYWSIIREG